MQMPQLQPPGGAQRTEGPGEAVPFEGFDPPESNFWRLPNNWFDLAAHFTSWAEHKVVEYILRHTWGYHEYGIAKLITMDEFMHGRKRRDGSRLDAGCGMAENSIKKGIADAVAHGFLTVQIDDSDRGRIKKYYAPRMRRPPVDEGAHSIPVQDQSLPVGGQSLTPDRHPVTPGPHTLTLQAPDPIPTAQPLILGGPVPDPRTEETPLETHPVQDTRSKNNPVVVLPRQEPQARRARRGKRRPDHPLTTHRPQTPSYPAPSPAYAPHPAAQAPAPHNVPSTDLAARLATEGIAPARAAALAAAFPAERIERQLAWIDTRTYRDRAATLVTAIEADFGPPPSPRRPNAAEPAGFDRAKYYRGSYALCPRCGSRPCIPGCGTPHLSGAKPPDR